MDGERPDRMNIVCNNCGNNGHLYRDCKHPILSYGILLFHQDIHSNFKVVMIERKNSISYIEFLRGKYKDIYNIGYIKLLMNRCSVEEKRMLCLYDFEKLWNDLWIHTETINSKIKREYKSSKNKFEKLKKGYIHNGETISLESMISESKEEYVFNEWEIPKGRRNTNENNKECAIREFKEETNISEDKYDLFTNVIPICESYLGLNNVRYKHVYYLARIKENCDLYIDENNKEQYTEVKDIKWITKGILLDHIRDYDILKQDLLYQFFLFLETSYKENIYIR